jgi:hypothetical protein
LIIVGNTPETFGLLGKLVHQVVYIICFHLWIISHALYGMLKTNGRT